MVCNLKCLMKGMVKHGLIIAKVLASESGRLQVCTAYPLCNKVHSIERGLLSSNCLKLIFLLKSIV